MQTTEHATATVVIADDHEGVRAALAMMLERTSDLTVVGVARNGEEAIELAARLEPRVVVMDLTMPNVNGVDATRRICRRSSHPVVVALSGSRELIRDAVAAGAAYVILKDEDPARMLEVIRTAADL